GGGALGSARARRGCAGYGRHFALPVAGVTVERPRRRELAQLVSDHVLRDEDWDELSTVVHRERQPDGVRRDCAPTGPGLDDLLALSSRRRGNLLGEVT